MTYAELYRLAKEMGAKDAGHVCGIASMAVFRFGESAQHVLSSIRRNQPALFYSKPERSQPADALDYQTAGKREKHERD